MLSRLKVFKGYYISVLIAILLPFFVSITVWEYQMDADIKLIGYLITYFGIYLLLFSMLIESLDIGLKKYLLYIPSFFFVFLLSTQYFEYTSIVESYSFIKEINYKTPIIDIITLISLIFIISVCNRGKNKGIKYEYPLMIQYIYLIVPFVLFFMNLFISMSQSSFGIFAIIYFIPAVIISIMSQILFYILYKFIESQNKI